MRIVMLIQNDWKHDSRVIREAEALAEQGHEIHVACRRLSSAPATEACNGVRYHCVPHTTVLDPRLALRAHAAAMLLDMRWLLRGPRRGVALGAVARHVALLAAAAGPGLIIAGLIVLRRVLPPGWSNRFRLATLLLRTRELMVPVFSYVMQPFTYLYSCLDTVLALRPEVVHAHDLVTLSAGTLAAQQLRARLIYDAHELECHTNYHSLNRWTKYWIARYETAFATRCDAVITVCDSIAGWLAREYRIQKPIVVGNAPSVRSPVLSGVRIGETVRKRLGLGRDSPLVVYVGSVTLDRGLELCVRALEHLPGAHLAVVGPRYSATEAGMIDAARAIGEVGRLHLVDPVAPGDVMGFISDADCSVMAIQNVCLSYYFCLPNKLLESVLAGLPVVVSDLLELRRFVEQFHVGVVVDERDPRSIANGLREVLSRPDQYRPSFETIAAVETRYGWGEQKRRLTEVYGRLLRVQLAQSDGSEPRAEETKVYGAAQSPDGRW